LEILIVGLGIALILEGILYASMPDRMKRLMAAVLQQESGSLRAVGLGLALAGLVLVAIVRL
jgi:uncharacterized protein YjeT (DUF2065 family)